MWSTRANSLYRAKLLGQPLSDKQRELYMLWRVDNMARAAVSADQTDDAQRFALEMLRIPELCREVMPNHDIGHDARFVYDAHIILGKVALACGEVDSSERLLLEAAAAWPVDSGERTYGPDFELAAALLREGRTDAVLAYLRTTRRFTVLLEKQIDHWIGQIEEGRTPDFRDWSHVEVTVSSFFRTIRAQWRAGTAKRSPGTQTR